jgi:hypothetical protein
MKTFKERARYSGDWAKKADAAETRWRRFADGGPPPAPVVDQRIRVRMRGADSARKALVLEDVGVDGPVRPFSDEVHLPQRLAGVAGPRSRDRDPAGEDADLERLENVRLVGGAGPCSGSLQPRRSSR